jgi:hypothetical protein
VPRQDELLALAAVQLVQVGIEAAHRVAGGDELVVREG